MLAKGQKLVGHTKQPAIDARKTALKRAIRKTAEATGDWIGNKISDKVTNVWKTSPQNSSEKVESETETRNKNLYLQKKTANYWIYKTNITI